MILEGVTRVEKDMSTLAPWPGSWYLWKRLSLQEGRAHRLAGLVPP